ncbi:MAG TPA: PD-(D/E)XK nuclease family protein [Acidimicrobiales bacterium]|nr:PD-(D/E)XK nuclease family protein [Acidimicrobiales bacterium]
MTALASYSPAQQRVIDLLGRSAEDRPVPAELVAELRAELEERVAVAAARVPEGTSLFVGKSGLHQLDTCEGRWQAEASGRFRWTVPSARGTVAHKAIELGANWRGEADPCRLVDEATTRLADDAGALGTFLRALSTVELAELRRDAVAFVTAFEECFPPLKGRWRPVVDGPSKVPLAGGRVVLSGRPDLTLGRAADGGKVVIDLKTGRPSRHHVDDLRFYALVDACKVGIAPRRLATLYLDAGQPVAEPVTPGVLEAATERVARAVEAMVEIRTGARPATVRPGPGCRWCPAAGGCEAGSAWLAADDAGEHEDGFWWDADPTT